ncbi:hypothetical protein GCM10009863_27530 [Streptomyces axinellae]|uniref:GntR C-terminal domain-containing protein n=1 Tax=Streptomyces axinellae TaxID=552788 RepID=A0ABN3Q1Z0_9ACTN
MVGAPQPRPGRAEEHRRLEEAVLARDADTAAQVLVQYLTLTATGLTESTHPGESTHPDTGTATSHSGPA